MAHVFAIIDGHADVAPHVALARPGVEGHFLADDIEIGSADSDGDITCHDEGVQVEHGTGHEDGGVRGAFIVISLHVGVLHIEMTEIGPDGLLDGEEHLEVPFFVPIGEIDALGIVVDGNGGVEFGRRWGGGGLGGGIRVVGIGVLFSGLGWRGCEEEERGEGDGAYRVYRAY